MSGVQVWVAAGDFEDPDDGYAGFSLSPINGWHVVSVPVEQVKKWQKAEDRFRTAQREINEAYVRGKYWAQVGKQTFRDGRWHPKE